MVAIHIFPTIRRVPPIDFKVIGSLIVSYSEVLHYYIHKIIISSFIGLEQ
jgi:hypothetical protein